MKMYFWSCVLFLLSMTSCSEFITTSVDTGDLRGKTQGGYSDLIVVAEDWCWDKGLKDDISFVFSEEIKGLYNPESNFDVTHVRPNGFSSLFKRQRTILVFDVSKSISKSGIGFKTGKFAKEQLYIKISARSFEEASSLLLTAKAALREKLNEHRIRGLQNKVFHLLSEENQRVLMESMKVSINVPKFYSPVVNNNEFVYFGKRAKASCESGQNSQCSYQLGIFVSKMNYKSEEMLEKEAFIALRDSLTKKHIIGPENSKSTFMELEKKVPISSLTSQVNGHYCVVYKGWWNMVNATMGGPFISYLIVNERTNKLYMIDGFIFAPNFSKRDFIKELEAIIKTVNFN